MTVTGSPDRLWYRMIDGMADDIIIKIDPLGDAAIVIPASTLDWSATRSSGPGGQHVNTSSTKVELRFDPEGTDVLNDSVKERLRELAGGRTDADGRIVITSQNTRSQARNLEEARARLADLIYEALQPPPPPRRQTRPSRSARRRRLDAKRRQAEKKRLRGKPSIDD